MKVDLNKVITAVVIAFICTALATIWDFQNVKAHVEGQDDKIEDIRLDLREVRQNDLREIKNDIKTLLQRN